MLRRIAMLLGIGRCATMTSEPTKLPSSSCAPPEAKNIDDGELLQSECGPPRADRLNRVPLKKLGLLGPLWRRRLAGLEIHTAAQLISVTAEQWRQCGMTSAEISKLRRWSNAVRLASQMPSMKPYEAMMLFAIHRRHLSRLAGELPGRLHRDLLRFSLSSRGERLLRSRPIPDRHQVEGWIRTARSLTRDSHVERETRQPSHGIDRPAGNPESAAFEGAYSGTRTAPTATLPLTGH